jgi:predicted 2-oxoglutarate/Fe(II)-dependent dioxygenase YbiX
MADAESLLAPLFARLAPLLPPALGGGSLVGLNPRFRFYRYAAGCVYRPHVDGAWPESAVRGGAVVHDAHGGARWSRLTLVLYLNDDFVGGATTFFAAAPDAAGVLEARGVRPARGCALLFPHGDAAGSLVHEGSAVARGAKYIVRTDVVYERAAAPARGRAGAA